MEFYIMPDRHMQFYIMPDRHMQFYIMPDHQQLAISINPSSLNYKKVKLYAYTTTINIEV